jgi:hypothetical protein
VLELDLYLVGCVDGFHYRVAVILRSYNDTGAMQWASWHQDLMGSDSPVMVTASFENTEGVRHICQATLLDMHPALPEEERPVAILEYAFSGLMAPDEDALLSFLAADGSSLRAIRQAQELGMSAAEVRALTVGESADMLLPPPTNTCHTVLDAGGKEDNAHLPIGDAIAILLVGVTRPMTSAVSLGTLQEHVCTPLWIYM